MSKRINWTEKVEVPGSLIITDAFTQADHGEMVYQIDKEGRFEPDYDRMAQRYGWRYDHKTKTLTRIVPVADWLQPWCDFVYEKGWMKARPDQVTVQEYQPGTGIGDHCDDKLCFGPDIVTFSLLAPCTYQLKHMKTKQMLSLVLEPRTVVVLTGEARKQWKHGIPTTKGSAIRRRRLSITFRTIKPRRVRLS